MNENIIACLKFIVGFVLVAQYAYVYASLLNEDFKTKREVLMWCIPFAYLYFMFKYIFSITVKAYKKLN